MPESAPRVHVDQADWTALLPFVRLFRGFRMAIHPAKLLLALLLVVLTYLGGLGMDLIWGAQVTPGEVRQHLGVSGYAANVFEAPPRDIDSQNAGRAGVFETTLAVQSRAFEQLIVSATQFNFGFTGFLAGKGFDSGGVLGALSVMILGVPGWLYTTHPAFLAVFLAFAFLLMALFGGAIARLAAVQATRDLRPSAFTALRFTAVRYPWFVLMPIIPLIVVVLIGVVLGLAGLLLFNFAYLDVVGGALFGLFLLAGFVMSVILIGLLIAAPLLLPSLAVEGTDAFEASSRVFHYVTGRPWQYLFYNLVMVVYGAVTYLFVGLVVFLTLWCTKVGVGLWAFASIGEDGPNRFDAILPAPRLGELVHTVEWAALDGTGATAAAIVMVWVKLLIALLPAFAVSFFFCEQTWIYLLLRRSADGSELDEVHLEAADQPEREHMPDKVEPAETGAASGESQT